MKQKKSLLMPEAKALYDRHCSLGDLRSWTDMVTNMMSLSGVQIEQDLQALLGHGLTPSHLLPGFVHEATHHWCFLSPVGFVLSYLQLRARRTGVLLYNNQGDARMLRDRLVGDVVRYETALAMLRPLAEGLAMFTEFDATSGKASSVFSVPTELIGWLFSGGLENIRYGRIHFPLEGTRRPLVEWRRSKQCLRRKVAMFGHPFEVTNGGYLPGYLALRHLWFQTARADPRLLNESDLFLMFVRSFFYDDYELVTLLLDDSPVEFATSERIIIHIKKRLDALEHVNTNQIRCYEQAVTKREHQQELGWLIDIVASDKELAKRGCRMSNDLLEQIETPDLESVDGLLALWDRELLKQREVINFGKMDVQVDIGKDGICHVMLGEATIHVGPSMPETGAGAGPGSVHVFCSTLTDTKARAVAVYRGNERVAIFFSGPDERNQGLLTQFLQLGNPYTFQSGTEEMRSYMENVLAWEGVAELIGEMRAMLPKVCEGIYAAKAFAGMSEMQRSRAVAAMKDDGLLPLLNWNRALEDGVALLSISWSLRLRRPQIAEFLADHDIALEDILQAIAGCTRQYGIPIVWEDDDLLLCSV